MADRSDFVTVSRTGVLPAAFTKQSKRRDCLTGLTRNASMPASFNSAGLNDCPEEVKFQQRHQKRHGSFAKPFCAKALDLRGPTNLGRSSHGEHWGLDSSLPQKRAGRSGAPALVKVMLDRLAICIGLRGGPASKWLYPEVFHYWLKNMGRNGSKIALRRNFYVAFRTFVGI